MSIIPDEILEQLRELFAQLERKVTLVLFTREVECPGCRSGRDLIEAVAGISEKVEAKYYDFIADSEKAGEYRVDKTPAIIPLGAKDYGIRFYGIPAGFEFTNLILAILDVSAGMTDLEADTLAELDKVDKPVHIQVVAANSCPSCPAAVRTAHRFAVANDNIRADMVDGVEFPDLVAKYKVAGVPHTVINETETLMGGATELEFAQAVIRAIGK